MSENTGKQGGAPALPNNFSANTPTPGQPSAPPIKGQSTLNWVGPSDSENRGKDGTQK